MDSVTPSGSNSPSPRSRGSETPRYIQFAPKRAMQSFDNLVALANHQERLRGARNLVWRDRGQPVVELSSLKDCWDHATRGGLRAGSLALSMRACVNLVLALLRIRNIPKKYRLSVIRHALFGEEVFRFGTMLGSFVLIYKYLLNALPILIIPGRYKAHEDGSETPFLDDDSGSDDVEAGQHQPRQISQDALQLPLLGVPLSRRRARLSLSAEAQMILIRKKTRWWHALFAGTVAGGLAIMIESKSRRKTIAQQLFVRGLQGSVNALKTKRNIKIPHGDILVFSLACGQILYAFLLRPDTLPHSYNTWVGQASKVPSEGVSMNRDLFREGTFKLEDIDAIIGREGITSTNREILKTLRQMAMSAVPDFGERFAPCAAIHPEIDSCAAVPAGRFLAVFRWMLPIYGALHLVPAVLFKRAQFWREPRKIFLRAMLGTTRSSAFLGVFVIIYQGWFCFKHNAYILLSSPQVRKFVPELVLRFLLSSPSFWMGGFLSGLSLFVEEKRRREELAMYVLPKAMESAWKTLRGKGLAFKTEKYGEILLTATAMGMVMNTYQNDPQHLSGFVRRILYQFVGPN